MSPADPPSASGAVLGIDPGLASTGYAVLESGPARRLDVLDLGTIRTSPRTPHAERLAALHRAISELAERHAIQSAAIESWFVHPVSTSAMGMAEARGAILAGVATATIAVTEYSPTTIKAAVTGHGRADKRQVRLMVERLSGARPATDHAADALAAAICHIGSSPLAGVIRDAR